jgi:hypothetical protein
MGAIAKGAVREDDRGAMERAVESAPPAPVAALRLRYPEIYRLGAAEGYPEDQVTEAINVEGAGATLKFLREHEEPH